MFHSLKKLRGLYRWYRILICLKVNKVPYKIDDNFDKCIRAYAPSKNNLPYLRMTNFDSAKGIYCRDTGMVFWQDLGWCLKRCKEIGKCID